jgi:hypothetical protein
MSADPGSCVSTVRTAVSLPDEMIEDLGTRQVGEQVSFSIVEGTSAFSLVSQAVGGTPVDTILLEGEPLPNTVVPTDLRAPDGALYYDDLAEWPTVVLGGTRYYDVSGLLAHDLGFHPIAGAFPVPSTSAAVDRILTAGQVVPGTWTFTVNDWAHECASVPGCSGTSSSGTYRLHAVKRPEPPAATGTLDVEVYLATDPTSVLSTAAGAHAHPQMTRWVQSLSHYLGKAGLCVGNVTLHDLPQWVKERYAQNGTVDLSQDGPCDAMRQLFANGTAPTRAVQLFLADDILAPAQGSGITIAGVTGSIPAPGVFPGTVNGGAVVGIQDFATGSCSGSAPALAACGTDRMAYVAAHEIGHWLGLYHTTEGDGAFFDPVSDTARCLDRCARNFSALTNGRCVLGGNCGGGRNLMFWLLDPTHSTGELSPHQGQIVRLNPAVR